MLTQYFTRAATLKERRRGMIGSHLDEFITWLEQRGYRRWTIRCHIRGAVRFTLWARQRHFTLGDLDRTRLEQFRRLCQLSGQGRCTRTDPLRKDSLGNCQG